MDKNHKHVFDQKAKRLQEVKRELLQQQALIADATIADLESALENECAEMPPCRLLSARLSDEDLAEASAFFDASLLSRDEVIARRSKALLRVGPPAATTIGVLESMDVRSPAAPNVDLPWLRSVVYNRLWFRSCIFRFIDDGDIPVYAKVVYCVQHPMMICFVKLEKVRRPGDGVPAFAANHHVQEWAHHFRIEYNNFIWTDDGCIDLAWRIDIMTCAMMQPRGVVVADGMWQPISAVVAIFQEGLPAAAEAAAADPEPDAKLPSPFADAPWLFDEVMFSELADDLPKDKVAKSVSDVIKDVLDAATHEEVLDMLYEKRGQMASVAPASYDFVWSVPAWTHMHAGVPYDSFRGQAHNGDPKAFCVFYKLPKSATFAISQHTEFLAQEMAVEWCSKLQYFYDLWVAQGSQADYDFDPESVQGYQERAAFTDAVRGAGAATMQRVRQIRGLVLQRVGAEAQRVGLALQRVSA